MTLAIAATLAAILLPALIGQISKGDAGRTANDIVAVQTAIGAFTSDVRRFPRNLEQLNSRIETGTGGDLQDDLRGQPYPQTLVDRWRGPYLGKSLVNSNLPSGFGASLLNAFDTTTSNTYLEILFAPLSLADFNTVDLIIDEEASSTTGQLRFAGDAASGTGRFLAVPLQ